MPLYFVDVHDGISIIDDEGVELAGLEDAKEAIRASGAMLSERKELWSGELWKMEIREEDGAIAATLTFSAH